MKTMKLIYPLAFALAITLASTGCKHKPVGLTPMTNINPPPPGISGNTQTMNEGVPPAPPINPFQAASSQAGGGTLPENWDLGMVNQDRVALAAYTIHFAFDSAVIRDSDQANLQSVASALAADPNAKLLIEGNCDERGTEEYNRALGERRALAAREALAKLQVDPMRIRTESYGKDKPVDPGHDEAAWRANRRDDFVLLHPKTGM
jgi:peptidoglycan-associated lipoprotein